MFVPEQASTGFVAPIIKNGILETRRRDGRPLDLKWAPIASVRFQNAVFLPRAGKMMTHPPEMARSFRDAASKKHKTKRVR
jgi:hypothetical protein